MTTLSPGAIGRVVSTHRNSENELLTIEQSMAAEFDGQYVLCVYDDDTPTVAPTLLDTITARWLRDEIEALFAEEDLTA